MRKIFVLVCIVLLSVNTWGQELPKIVPPSPEASALFKFSEIPVSLYTGLPNIDIPLFTIESGGVTVPISISYHARGIQVAEIASRVGTGWTLNCGGMISKQVRDKDDNFYNDCFDYSRFFTEADYRISVSASLILPIWETCDLMPDVYSFSVNGMSGKMLRNAEGWFTQNYSNIKFSSNQITDGSGNKYFFGENNASDHEWTGHTITILHNTSVPNNDGTVTSPNTFHLTRIETATGASIEYEYSNEQTNYYRRGQDKFTDEGIIQSTAINIVSNQKRIDRIIFDKGEVLFEYSAPDREDMPGTSYLEKIILKDKSGQIVKQALFDYEYTTSNDEVNMNWFFANYYAPIQMAARKRLFLKSVQIADKNDVTLPPYRFEYDDTILPSRHSNSVDIWGYYNGKNNGAFLEKGIDDRTVDTTKVQAGLLKKIIKPEGGETNFYYEPNVAVNVFPESVGFESPNPKIHKEITQSNFRATSTDYDFITDDETGLPHYDGLGTYTDVFTISQFKTGPLTYIANGSGIMGCPCTLVGCPQVVNPDASCLFHLFIDKWNADYGFVIHTPLFPGTRTLNLAPGVYRLRAQYKSGTHTPTNEHQQFHIYMSWYEEESSFAPAELLCFTENLTGNKVIYAAGNRIKKIEYKDTVGNIELTKSYSYVHPNSQNPSGRVLGLSEFAEVTHFDMNGQPAVAQNQASSIAGLYSTFQSNTVGYKYITEYYGDGNSTIGKTDYAYSMIYDSGNYYEFPQHPPTDNEWLRGKELSVTHYKKSGNNYEIIQKKENSYLFADELEYTGSESLCYHPFLKPSVILPITQNFAPSGGYEKNRRYYTFPYAMSPIKVFDSLGVTIQRYKTYYSTGGSMDLKRTTLTDYFENGDELVTSTEYGYDYDRHYGVAATQQTTSDGNVFWNRYQYAQSMEMQNDSMSSILIAKNMVDVVLRKDTRRNLPEKLSAEVTRYKDWGNGIIAPEIIQTSKGLNNLEDRIKYIDYDLHGNPLEVKQENGISISYIWGYNHTQPVAKIENIAYSSIPTNLINAIHSATNESALFLALEELRDHSDLANSMVTTFTYIPLVGVKTMTDPKGYTMTYHYDDFNRLWKVTDMQNNILSENQYHYRTQN